ncbi:MAG: sugar transferase [Clostridia bacterium]|nr:sugar transferase [Clostridia bacterium]
MKIFWKDFEKLPKYMQTKETKAYYDILKKRKFSIFIKRIFDITVSLIASVFLVPIIILLAIIIMMDSPGNPFFLQTRVTKYGKKFKIFKFRTMVQGAEKLGAQITTDHDPRITRVGKYIRKLRADEFPQIFNIIMGDLSFVGVRPEVPKYVDKYTPEMYATLLMPAGVTSLTSILYKDEEKLLKSSQNADETYVNKVLPEKMKYNLEYIKNFDFFGDIKIMFKTVIAVISR